jgi:hypothetical protein
MYDSRQFLSHRLLEKRSNLLAEQTRRDWCVILHGRVEYVIWPKSAMILVEEVVIQLELVC